MPAALGPQPATPLTTLAAPGHLVALTANLQNPYARSGRMDLQASLGRLEIFARLVEAEGAGILMCQEVGRGREFRVDTWLAERLGMAAVYARANGDAKRFGREEGLAILSGYPLFAPVTCLLAGGLWRRPALGVVVDSPLGEVVAYTAHLSLRPWRNRRQPARLRAWVAATAGERPAIIGGDFNAHETAPAMAGLRREWVDCYREIQPTGAALTHEMRCLGRRLGHRLDYIFWRPANDDFRVVESRIIQTALPFSDHRAVSARIEQHSR